MALALRLDHLVRTGAIADYATLARLGHVSRARVSQILSLLLLAPDIQETLLFLPPTEPGRDSTLVAADVDELKRRTPGRHWLSFSLVFWEER